MTTQGDRFRSFLTLSSGWNGVCSCSTHLSRAVSARSRPVIARAGHAPARPGKERHQLTPWTNSCCSFPGWSSSSDFFVFASPGAARDRESAIAQCTAGESGSRGSRPFGKPRVGPVTTKRRKVSEAGIISPVTDVTWDGLTC